MPIPAGKRASPVGGTPGRQGAAVDVSDRETWIREAGPGDRDPGSA